MRRADWEGGKIGGGAMPNLVTQLVREYRRTLMARHLAEKAAKSPAAKRTMQTKLKWPPAPEKKPHKPAPDYHLRSSHL